MDMLFLLSPRPFSDDKIHFWKKITSLVHDMGAKNVVFAMKIPAPLGPKVPGRLVPITYRM